MARQKPRVARRLDAAQLQLATRVKKPRGTILAPKVLYAAFEKALDGEAAKGITFRLTLWDGREIDLPLDDSPRARTLAKVLRRLLRAGRIPFDKVVQAS